MVRAVCVTTTSNKVNAKVERLVKVPDRWQMTEMDGW